jgi:hypothetical protein
VSKIYSLVNKDLMDKAKEKAKSQITIAFPDISKEDLEKGINRLLPEIYDQLLEESHQILK